MRLQTKKGRRQYNAYLIAHCNWYFIARRRKIAPRRIPVASISRVREDIDRHGFDLLKLKPAFESGHTPTRPLSIRLEDRGAIGAVEIQSWLGQVRRAESNDAVPSSPWQSKQLPVALS